jgi:S-DNA-T family DNA segregation ATPase FtsK/SpoIIIE
MDLLLPETSFENDEEHIRQTAVLIEKTLEEFQIPARVVGYRVGPTVTQYAIEPGYTEAERPDGSIQRKKVRISQISGLSRDLARALSAERLRIEAPVPGHSFVGIEVANPKSTTVRLRALLESKVFKKVIGKPLALTLGRDVSGETVIADLSSMPHLLIAGTTGSGKSVCLEAITACLIMNNSPADLRLAMLDPKMVELVRFNGLPHMLGSVETDLDRMLTVLRWALVEMENRYRVLESAHTRDLDAYNKKLKRQGKPGLPRIVIMIDELADLMMIAPEQTEHSLTRLAQKARATGIHLVVATQRPSTDVVTGMIKANFPARIAFQVATGIDSRVIIDTQGAEELLGNGDMLFVDPSVRAPVRAQGVLISDNEIERILRYWQNEFADEEEAPDEEAPWEPMIENASDEIDALFDEAVETVLKTGRANASWLQRSLRIGYPRAASLLDQMEAEGIIGPSRGGGRDREILVESIRGEDEAHGRMQDDHTRIDEDLE